MSVDSEQFSVDSSDTVICCLSPVTCYLKIRVVAGGFRNGRWFPVEKTEGDGKKSERS